MSMINVTHKNSWIKKLSYNLNRVPEMLKFTDLCKKHSKGGADFHYIDKNTPKGLIKCLRPDGTLISEKLKRG